MKLIDCHQQKEVTSGDIITRRLVEYQIHEINYEKRTAKIREGGKLMAWTRTKEELDSSFDLRFE